MIYLNAGNLWDNDYLDTVISWNKEFEDTVQVKSLFGSVVGMTATARSADRLPQRDWKFIVDYIERAQGNDIAIRYTLNQSCIGSIQDFDKEWRSTLGENLNILHQHGINEWTVTSPLLVELLRSMFPTDFIEVSTIAEVSTPEDAERWLELGVDGVNISTSINRDFNTICTIDETGIDISILANEACLFRCPYRRDCYNLSSHNSSRSEELFGFYPFRRCTEVRLAEPAEWLKARLVLPQWMNIYQNELGINWFKVAFRTHPIETALPMLRHYMEQSFTGNLLELWPTISHLGDTIEPKDKHFIDVKELEKSNFLEYFLTHGSLCALKACKDCRYCDRVYQMAVGSR